MNRRGFLGGLGALLGAATLGLKLSLPALVHEPAALDVPAMAEWMMEVYNSKDFFRPFHDETTPFLVELGE